jgi:hypothetical protein
MRIKAGRYHHWFFTWDGENKHLITYIYIEASLDDRDVTICIAVSDKVTENRQAVREKPVN